MKVITLLVVLMPAIPILLVALLQMRRGERGLGRRHRMSRR